MLVKLTLVLCKDKPERVLILNIFVYVDKLVSNDKANGAFVLKRSERFIKMNSTNYFYWEDIELENEREKEKECNTENCEKKLRWEV